MELSEQKFLQFASDKNFLSEYRTLQFLGSGSFGEVWTCQERRDRRGKEFAVKIIDKAKVKSSSQRNDILREVGFLNIGQGQHPGIVQLKEVLESKREIHLVMENCKGGDLLKLVTKHGRIPERFAKMIFRQLASALAHCHSKGIIHRDIKPENILFDRDASSLCSPGTNKHTQPVQAKLADFGLSVMVAPGDTTKGCAGSKFYVAPEMVKGKEYDSRVDTWSLGVVLCAMLTGRLPFTGKTFEDDSGLVKAILHAELDFRQPHWKGISKGARNLIKQMLERVPEKRLTSEDLVLHPWLTEEAQHKLLLNLLPFRRSAPRKPGPKHIDLPITLSDLDEPERRTPEAPTVLERRSRTPVKQVNTVIPIAGTDSSEDCFGNARMSPRFLASPYSPRFEAVTGDSYEESSRFALDVGIRTGCKSPLKSPLGRPIHPRPSVWVQENKGTLGKETYYAHMLGLNPNSLCRKDLVTAH